MPTTNTAADRQQRTKFGNFEFPVSQHRLHGKGRSHTHEYWKSPGGDAEKGGRGLWDITLRALFHNRFPDYPGLYSETMPNLRRLYERQTTDALIHPSYGSMIAYITEWNQVKEAKVRSGETVDITFIEDVVLDAKGFVEPAQATIVDRAAILAARRKDILAQLALPEKQISVFDALQTVVNAFDAVSDTAGMYGNLVGAKIAQIVSLCERIDQFRAMGDPVAYPIMEAVRELWAAAVEVQGDVQRKREKLQTHVVEVTTTMQGVAIAIYGDVERSGDLATLNGARVNDPLRVRAGTEILYYPA